MRVALGNLGPVTFALQASLRMLDIDVLLPPSNSYEMYNLSYKYLPLELCYPLKVLLGNYLYFKDDKPDAVIYYGGCDLCNLTPITYAFTDIFNGLNWSPETYYCDINSKKDFVLSYFSILSKLSNKDLFSILKSISFGASKFEAFNFIDQVFYNIRPAFIGVRDGEELYNKYFNKLINSESSKEVKQISKELLEIYCKYSLEVDSNSLKIGLVGDPFSLSEPFIHQYTDKLLGNMGVVIDKWSDHRFITPEMRKIQDKPDKSIEGLLDIVKNNYGVFTQLEMTKLYRYINRGYDAIVFISPFECNPNDALRNHLTAIEKISNVPILSLVFDEHTSSLGVKLRLEAFIDMLSKKKLMSQIQTVNS